MALNVGVEHGLDLDVDLLLEDDPQQLHGLIRVCHYGGLASVHSNLTLIVTLAINDQISSFMFSIIKLHWNSDSYVTVFSLLKYSVTILVGKKDL